MSHFFAYLLRMKLIERWSLMRNLHKENIQEHSFEVAVIAHTLALVKNKYYGGELNCDRIALLALYHDSTEVLTGDLPTPVKYFNPQIKEAYKKLEVHAAERLIDLLPEDLRSDFKGLIHPDEESEEVHSIIKAADTLSAYIKCMVEKSAGNQEFERARKTLEEKLLADPNKEVQYFLEHFVPSFSLSLDDLSDPLSRPNEI